MSDVSFMCTRICASILRLMGVSRTPLTPGTYTHWGRMSYAPPSTISQGA